MSEDHKLEAEDMKQEQRRGRVWLTAVIWIGLGLGVAFYFLEGFPGRLNVEGMNKLKTGMTLAEVQAILGGPPGNYGGFDRSGGFMTMEGFTPAVGQKLTEKIWNDNENRLELYFDANDKLVAWHKRFGYSRVTPLTWARMWIQSWWRGGAE